jgi:alpha-mannosidase
VKLPLVTVEDDGTIVTLHTGALRRDTPGPIELRYPTRTGALLRLDGVVCGAFDREHESIVVHAPSSCELTLEVERRSLPTTGLPSGDGLVWRGIVARAEEVPGTEIEAGVPQKQGTPKRRYRDVPLVGHSHLDVAWLWTYEATARKAERTLATAVRQLEADADFIYTQSQPQLFAFVAERDPAFFERVRALARSGRIDTSGAAMWVEPDCNIPSGESLLRQLVFGIRYVEREFGRTPTVAWLPDSFGFANTFPTLLRHAGIPYFGTTKLGWNDTTEFPYARFRWAGPDGSSVVAAQIASIAGNFEPLRVAKARRRGDLLLIGHGDGGGGASDRALADAPAYGRWTALGDWFAAVAATPSLPVVSDELYLEEHRGTATTHHDIKAANAALERGLGSAELSLAWARALHASPFFLDEARRQLAQAWQIALRAQFHDVLPGTAISDVYVDVREEYEAAQALVRAVEDNARSVLPVAGFVAEPRPVAPRRAGGGAVFENATLVARVRRDGTLAVLRTRDGKNLVRRAHRLARYADTPKRWDAWNVDRDYRKRARRVRVAGTELTPDGFEVRYAFGGSVAVARYTLDVNEPFLRVEWAVDWRERHELLRIENDLAFVANRARFGTPHGTIDRSPDPQTRAERAKFEAPGQRYGRLDGARGGVALMALDTYGWSLERGRRGSSFGHSLLRAPTWPDPESDLGVHAFSLAFLPFDRLGMGELERAWERFAGATAVPMFTTEDPSLLVVATKLADEGNGIVVRVRECDGVPSDASIRCGARARSVACIDALERPVDGEARLEEGGIRAHFGPFELRSFLVDIA